MVEMPVAVASSVLSPSISDVFTTVMPSALRKSRNCWAASAAAAQQFLDFLKAEGITVVNTSLMDGLKTDEATATGISTIADTWIHLSYVVQDLSLIHISEPTRQAESSYAVFCLKKKK